MKAIITGGNSGSSLSVAVHFAGDQGDSSFGNYVVKEKRQPSHCGNATVYVTDLHRAGLHPVLSEA